MKKPRAAYIMFFVLSVIVSSAAVHAEIKKTASNNVTFYALEEVKLQEKTIQDAKRQTFLTPYTQKDCNINVKFETRLFQGQYSLWMFLSLSNKNNELGGCYVDLKKTSRGKIEQYTLIPSGADYYPLPSEQWIGTTETYWGVKYPTTWQSECFEGQSDYNLYFLLALSDFEDLVAAEELELIVNLNHATFAYKFVNLNELRDLNKLVQAAAKQLAPSLQGPAYSLAVFDDAERMRELLTKNMYGPELTGLLSQLGRKDVIYLSNYRSYYFREKGISISAAITGEIINIGLHTIDTAPFGDYRAYRGKLPNRITFQEQRRTVEARLGQPFYLQPDRPGRYFAYYDGLIIKYHAAERMDEKGSVSLDRDYRIDSIFLSLDRSDSSPVPATIDPRGFVALLGKSFKGSEAQTFMKRFGQPQVSAEGEYTRYFFPDSGAYLKVTTATSIIRTLRFRPNSLGFMPYRGNFAGDIWFLDPRHSVEAQLGKPVELGHNEVGGLWAKYRTGEKIYYQYHTPNNEFNPVVWIELTQEKESPDQLWAYLYNVIGKRLDSPEVSAFIGSFYDYESIEYPRNPFVEFIVSKIFCGSDGVTVFFSDRDAPKVKYMTLNEDFYGSLPGGISFDDDRQSIWKKLGEPSEIYDYPGEDLTDHFAVGLEVTYYAFGGRLYPYFIDVVLPDGK